MANIITSHYLFFLDPQKVHTGDLQGKAYAHALLFGLLGNTTSHWIVPQARWYEQSCVLSLRYGMAKRVDLWMEISSMASEHRAIWSIDRNEGGWTDTITKHHLHDEEQAPALFGVDTLRIQGEPPSPFVELSWRKIDQQAYELPLNATYQSEGDSTYFHSPTSLRHLDDGHPGFGDLDLFTYEEDCELPYQLETEQLVHRELLSHLVGQNTPIELQWRGSTVLVRDVGESLLEKHPKFAELFAAQGEMIRPEPLEMLWMQFDAWSNCVSPLFLSWLGQHR